jgi:hypothetical protein
MMSTGGIISPDFPSRACQGAWIIMFAETTCVADARDVRSSGVVSRDTHGRSAAFDLSRSTFQNSMRVLQTCALFHM